MKLHPQLLAAFLCAAPVLHAAIIIPGANGSDGPLNITTDTVIDLSKAITGEWDTNNAAHAGDGVYDPSKWAVVFKYTDVNIAAGATVTFKNHPSRAPVVWLVQGTVTIHTNSVVSLDGQDGRPSPGLAEPGPGGFRGGQGDYSAGASSSAGYGVGGGGLLDGIFGQSGSYIVYTNANGNQPSYPRAYGNPSLVPLLGGSGGSGQSVYDDRRSGGGGGGGAILIATGGKLTVAGSITANGGRGGPLSINGGIYEAPCGSGGGIRLVADLLDGSGAIEAVGGRGANRSPGGLGRIRIERVSNAFSNEPNPSPSVVDLTSGSTALIWPPEESPQVRILSIGAKSVPVDPRAAFGTIGADVVLPLTSTTPVLVETTNVEQASQITVRVTPRANGNYTEVAAAVDGIVSNDPLVIRWRADLPVNAGYSAVQVKVIRP